MARNVTTFVCQSCGASYGRWQGKCESCGAWNTIAEESVASGVGGAPAKGPARAGAAKKGRTFALVGLDGVNDQAPRTETQVGELDRVFGGGLVKGSVILIGGDPGIGKSTLLIQASARLGRMGHRVVYISGEEAVGQVRLRAERLGLTASPVELAAETNVEDIVATLSEGPTPRLVVIDSIQTMWTDKVESAPGTVSQVRSAAQVLIRYAKKSGAALILVGHVTKDGQIAGPRVVEHMVDAVMSFEGEGGHHFRILRAVKNRFGPTDEIGVFEMTGRGLREVPNPSELFLAGRDLGAPGTAVFAGMEGTRPVLVEIQALVAASSLGTPRRAVVGWDPARLSMVLAVLDAHCGVRLGGHDVYLNVAGGLRIAEPAADLAVAAALVSSLSGAVLPADAVYFGEVSLSGAVRPVAQAASRLKEAKKLGFTRAVVPEVARGEPAEAGFATQPVTALSTLVADIAASGVGAGKSRAAAGG
ncbi:DNA repair protein RadA [Phreatobacter sp. AB_2022a]|uniref:DNA repair protein RadA n=1 Tax=Phreatobacter sp. AB_2022a TaxID=3003134 RepID=UPI0022873FF4|nr:DNA repair protein RadA [Phreatobacter sp. AB_2022a]MCZ0734038.1 DNA repair protein RadA [Phreatobacter sp. AB_2022a]